MTAPIHLLIGGQHVTVPVPLEPERWSDFKPLALAMMRRTRPHAGVGDKIALTELAIEAFAAAVQDSHPHLTCAALRDTLLTTEMDGIIGAVIQIAVGAEAFAAALDRSSISRRREVLS